MRPPISAKEVNIIICFVPGDPAVIIVPIKQWLVVQKVYLTLLNKNGESMSDNEHEIMIHGNDHFVGTGHNNEIIADNEDKTWILYAFDLNDPTAIGH